MPTPIESNDKPEYASDKFDAADLDARIGQADDVSDSSSHPDDLEFTDKQGHSMAIRTWESGDHAYIRAYDTDRVNVPEQVNIGQAGYANVTLENSPDGEKCARLNDIYVSPDYRGAGTGKELLGQAEDFARQKGAAELYGSIDSQEAQNFWRSQADQGWTTVPKGVYGETHKRLS